jgi:hypothetical protein
MRTFPHVRVSISRQDPAATCGSAITAAFGPLRGQRVVAGREDGCEALLRGESGANADPAGWPASMDGPDQRSGGLITRDS